MIHVSLYQETDKMKDEETRSFQGSFGRYYRTMGDNRRYYGNYMTEDEKEQFNSDWKNHWTPKMTEENKNEI